MTGSVVQEKLTHSEAILRAIMTSDFAKNSRIAGGGTGAFRSRR